MRRRGDSSFLYVFSIKGANSLISQVTDDDLGTGTGVNIRTNHFRFEYGIAKKVTLQSLFYFQRELRNSGQFPNFFVPLGAFAPRTYRIQQQLVLFFRFEKPEPCPEGAMPLGQYNDEAIFQATAVAWNLVCSYRFSHHRRTTYSERQHALQKIWPATLSGVRDQIAPQPGADVRCCSIDVVRCRLGRSFGSWSGSLVEPANLSLDLS